MSKQLNHTIYNSSFACVVEGLLWGHTFSHVLHHGPHALSSLLLGFAAGSKHRLGGSEIKGGTASLM